MKRREFKVKNSDNGEWATQKTAGGLWAGPAHLANSALQRQHRNPVHLHKLGRRRVGLAHDQEGLAHSADAASSK